MTSKETSPEETADEIQSADEEDCPTKESGDDEIHSTDKEGQVADMKNIKETSQDM